MSHCTSFTRSQHFAVCIHSQRWISWFGVTSGSHQLHLPSWRCTWHFAYIQHKHLNSNIAHYILLHSAIGNSPLDAILARILFIKIRIKSCVLAVEVEVGSYDHATPTCAFLLHTKHISVFGSDPHFHITFSKSVRHICRAKLDQGRLRL
jgi:hypothetical protein